MMVVCVASHYAPYMEYQKFTEYSCVEYESGNDGFCKAAFWRNDADDFNDQSLFYWPDGDGLCNDDDDITSWDYCGNTIWYGPTYGKQDAIVKMDCNSYNVFNPVDKCLCKSNSATYDCDCGTSGKRQDNY